MSNDIRETVKDLLDKVLDHLKGLLDGSAQSSEPELIPIPVRNEDDQEVFYRG